ncbi:MAG: aminoacyl-histidine dipeptidase [Pseudomonadota bacterium]
MPRGSGHEASVIAALRGWADERGFAHETDATGNLLIRVPASPGREDRGVVVLQGHVDMVCEKNSDKAFDFLTQGIDLVRDGDWIRADGTTLGADNGIGVAAAMAAAVDPEVQHPPLELLMTVDEETGMTGAFGLQQGFLSGRRLINCDTEEEGAIYVGCSGGGDVLARFPLEVKDRKEGRDAFRVEVKGLVGGHSGLDIHHNRANAIKCLARVLGALEEADIGFRLTRIDGGSMRNAVPREAGCGLCVKPEEAARLTAVVAEVGASLAAEFAGTDPDLTVTAEARPDCRCEKVFRKSFQRRVLRALLATPSSVIAMSGAVPGLVETSNNLGVVRTGEEAIELVCCSRSSVGSALEAVRQGLAALYELADGQVVVEDSYPGWQPDMQSPLLARALAVHEELFGKAHIKAVHAGLECGLLQRANPGCDMISIGPDIVGAHSPSERVGVGSTARFYQFLGALLAALD